LDGLAAVKDVSDIEKNDYSLALPLYVNLEPNENGKESLSLKVAAKNWTSISEKNREYVDLIVSQLIEESTNVY
jgi:hypothetical protein